MNIIKLNTVDGAWSPYGNWSVCTASCGGGTHTRTRACASPYPNYPAGVDACYGGVCAVEPWNPLLTNGGVYAVNLCAQTVTATGYHSSSEACNENLCPGMILLIADSTIKETNTSSSSISSEIPND